MSDDAEILSRLLIWRFFPYTLEHPLLIIVVVRSTNSSTSSSTKNKTRYMMHDFIQCILFLSNDVCTCSNDTAVPKQKVLRVVVETAVL